MELLTFLSYPSQGQILPRMKSPNTSSHLLGGYNSLWTEDFDKNSENAFFPKNE
jgi:hypothetical protein